MSLLMAGGRSWGASRLQPKLQPNSTTLDVTRWSKRHEARRNPVQDGTRWMQRHQTTRHLCGYGSEGWGLSHATGSSPSGRGTKPPLLPRSLADCEVLSRPRSVVHEPSVMRCVLWCQRFAASCRHGRCEALGSLGAESLEAAAGECIALVPLDDVRRARCVPDHHVVGGLFRCA